MSHIARLFIFSNDKEVHPWFSFWNIYTDLHIRIWFEQTTVSD